MKITYKNQTAEKRFSSAHQSKWKYPVEVAIKLRAAENLINAATNLQDIANYKPFKFHKLQGDRKHEWSISLGKTGYRVTLIPCDSEGNAITTGDIMAQCKTIKVVMVTEVSNHYE